MPPRKSVSSVKRSRSSSLSATPETAAKPEKKPRVAKVAVFPPASLAKDLHPARSNAHSSLPMLLGAHVSIAGGVAGALYRAGMIGASGLALFLKGHKQWKAKDLEADQIHKFTEGMKELNYPKESILVHGNYLVNLGQVFDILFVTRVSNRVPMTVIQIQSNGRLRTSVSKTMCIGVISSAYGSTTGTKAINQVHKDVPDVVCVIENMVRHPASLRRRLSLVRLHCFNKAPAHLPLFSSLRIDFPAFSQFTLCHVLAASRFVHIAQPDIAFQHCSQANAGSNIIGTAFTDLASIISLVDDKSRVQICLDTCHLFASGYDLRTAETYQATMADFDATVGRDKLAGWHLNDSKMDLGGNKDLHENIGLGKIGLSGFRAIMLDPLNQGMPMVLETPSPDKAVGIAATDLQELQVWKKEIALLYEIQGIGEDEWESKKDEIEKRWREERDTLLPLKPVKETKEKAKAKPKKGKKGKKQESENEDEDEESD